MSLAPTLTDGVVTIRPHRPDDALGSWEQSQDPSSQRWTTVPVPYAMEDARAFVGERMPAGWLDDSEWAFAIEYAGAYGGTISLRPEGEGRAEIAFGAHPAVRGTGAVERALRLLVDWGFAEQGLRTVIWWAHVGNWPSRRLAWKLGFSHGGTVRRWQPQRGELIDSWVGTLLRDDPRSPASTWLDCPVLEADGLRLRPVADRDAARIVEACSDPVTQQNLGFLPSPYTLDDAHDYIEKRSEMRATGSGVTWAVVDPAADEILSAIQYFDYQPGLDCEIGYWTHPEARGRGVTTRAFAAVLRHVFGELGVRRVKGFAAVDNVASRRVIEANGLRLYGVERLGANTRSGPTDLALYDLVAEEFAAQA